MSDGACPFKEFIIATADAATGPALAAAFEEDPMGVGAEHGLSTRQIVILVQGNPAKIQQELNKEGCGGVYKHSKYGLMT